MGRSKNEWGVFLARCQPIHNAHVDMIEKALETCSKVLIVLGSANKQNMMRNPFTATLRDNLIISSLIERFGEAIVTRVTLIDLPDWTTESDKDSDKIWGAYLYYNIVSRINCKQFDIFYSDDPQTILNWFDDDIRVKINFNFFDRSSMYDGLSATKIRIAFSKNDREYIAQCCPSYVVDNFEKLQDIWNSVVSNPQEDFSMN
jgi:nicotinamide-nucleotide adenylyltransferase